MLWFQSNGYRLTEEDGVLRIRLAPGYFAFGVVFGLYWAAAGLLASAFSLVVLWHGAVTVGEAVRSGGPFPWPGLFMIGGGLFIGWLFGNILVGWVAHFPDYLLHARDPIALDRRSGRVTHGKKEIGPLDRVAAVRYGRKEDEDGDSWHEVTLAFADGDPAPFDVWAFPAPAGAAQLAQAVADFLGVAAVEDKKPEPAPELAALSDDALAGDVVSQGGSRPAGVEGRRIAR